MFKFDGEENQTPDTPVETVDGADTSEAGGENA